MTKTTAIVIGLVIFASSETANAQTPTAAELLARIDEKVAAQNPYQALLNDPDPQRSLAAMEVMLESGDPTLIKMATEFGLLSPNPQVQRVALHGIMSTQPVLTLRLDGTEIESPNFKNSIQQWLKGSVTDEKLGYAPIGFGEWSEANSCYVTKVDKACGMTMTSDGTFLKIGNTTASVQLNLGADGVLTGSGFLYNVPDPVPMTIRLLE